MLEPGDRCLVVEDVVTTGGSTLRAIQASRRRGARSPASSRCWTAWPAARAHPEAAGGAPYKALATIDDIFPERPDRRYRRRVIEVPRKDSNLRPSP